VRCPNDALPKRSAPRARELGQALSCRSLPRSPHGRKGCGRPDRASPTHREWPGFPVPVFPHARSPRGFWQVGCLLCRMCHAASGFRELSLNSNGAGSQTDPPSRFRPSEHRQKASADDHRGFHGHYLSVLATVATGSEDCPPLTPLSHPLSHPHLILVIKYLDGLAGITHSRSSRQRIAWWIALTTGPRASPMNHEESGTAVAKGQQPQRLRDWE